MPSPGLNIKIHTPCRTAKSVGLGVVPLLLRAPSDGWWVLVDGTTAAVTTITTIFIRQTAVAQHICREAGLGQRQSTNYQLPFSYNNCTIYVAYICRTDDDGDGPVLARSTGLELKLRQSGKPFARLHNVSDNAMKRAVKLTQKENIHSLGLSDI